MLGRTPNVLSTSSGVGASALPFSWSDLSSAVSLISRRDGPYVVLSLVPDGGVSLRQAT